MMVTKRIACVKGKGSSLLGGSVRGNGGKGDEVAAALQNDRRGGSFVRRWRFGFLFSARAGAGRDRGDHDHRCRVHLLFGKITL